MNIARFARILLCFVLVCAFLVNASPIKVSATSAGIGAFFTHAVVTMPAGPVIASVLIGLGIYAVATSDAFDNLVDNIKMRLTDKGHVVDDQIDVAHISNGDSSTFAVDQELVESVRTLAFESGCITWSPGGYPVLSAGTRLGAGRFTTYANQDLPIFAEIPGSSATYVYLCSLSPFTYIASDRLLEDVVCNAQSIERNGVTLYYCYGAYEVASIPVDCFIASGYNIFDYAIGCLTGSINHKEGSVTVADGLGSGAIADPNVDLASGYSTWAGNAVNVNDDENNSIKPYWPVGLGSTYEETLAKTQEDIWNGVSEYTVAALENWDSLLNSISSIKTFLSNIWNGLGSWFDQIISGIAAIPDAISTWWQELIKKLEELWGDLASWWSSLVQTIVDALTSAFVLDEAYVMTQVQGMTSNFPFLASMVDFGRGLADVFYGIGSKPPVIYVDLSASESEVITGDKVVFLDLTWYEKYKPYGDSILSAFMYAWFGWKLLQTLPGLLNGSSGAVPNVSTFKRRDDE